MKHRRKSALGAGVVLAIVAGLLLVAVAPAFAANPAWEPDANSAAPYGNIVFYDSAGNVLTGGSNLSHLADYAAATTGPDANSNKANLLFARPDHTQANTTLWSTGAASASTTFPNPAAPAPLTGTGAPTPSGFQNPVVTLGSTDADLASFIAGIVPDTTAGYLNTYQVRLKDLGSGGAGSGTHYWSTDVLVDPAAGTWSVLYPTMTTTATTISTTPANGGNTTSGNNVTMTATVATVPPGGTFSGTVQFFDGTTAVGTPQAVSNGTPTTPVVTATTPPDGVHHYTAHFTPTGGTLVDDSTSAESVVSIGPPPTPTTVSLAVNNTTPAQGDPVTLTATVTSPASPPTGTMQFLDGGSTLLGTDTTESAPGSGIYSIIVNNPPGNPPLLSTGTHSITAHFVPSGNFSPSTSNAVDVTVSGTPSCQQPGSVCSDDQDIQVTVAAGSITISTPYTSTNRFNLGTMTLNPDGTLLSATATFPATTDQPIRVASTLAGDPGWTASASATNLNTLPANATPISAEGLGLTSLSLIVGPAGKTPPSFTSNPADDPSTASDDANSGLLAPAHTFAQKATDGNGTWDMRGTLTLLAPSSTLPGTYYGIITFTVV